MLRYGLFDEFAADKEPLDEVVEEKGVKLFVDPMLMFLIGTEMDYVEDKLQSGFVFNNPNEKAAAARESFHTRSGLSAKHIRGGFSRRFALSKRPTKMVNVYSIDGVTPVVHPSAFIHPTASLIGDVVIDPMLCRSGASIRADFTFRDGRAISRQLHGPRFAGEDIILGEDCNIGHGAVIHGAVLRDRVLVGMNAVVMDGVVLNDDVLVAALAFVPAAMEVLPGVIAAGTPARVLRELTDEEMEWKAAGNRDYHKLTVRCHETLEKSTR